MSGGLKLPVSHCETESICGIQFGVFKPEQLKQYGVCHVTSPVSYTLTGEPKPNGLADRRMGSTEMRVPCLTCSMEHPDCPGHFAYTELAEPVFNVGLFDITYMALTCICQNCGALLVDMAHRAELRDIDVGIDRLRACRHKRMTVCRQSVAGKSCGHEQALIRKPPPKARNGLYFSASRAQQETTVLASHVYQMLARVKDEDAVLMGFRPEHCHPKDLIMTVLPIPPPAVRPSVSFGGAARSENEITIQLAAVLKVNEKLRTAKDANAPIATLTSDIKRLQELISAVINNANTYYNPVKLRGRLPLTSITQRLKSKQGRLRGYLMGKRVDFSARTVITGDPLIDVDQVGVPRSIAMTLSVPEKVNEINRRWLTKLVQSTVYPGANYIIHKNGALRNLTKMQARLRKKLTLEIGDTVERHLQNGDPVLFNRQPTLHRMSMMGHRARVLPFNTFRLNLTCTTPYNADFDGDEMNLHVPQSLLTKAELIEIMMVTKNFVTPNKSQPCMGIVQDSLLGSFRITDRETFVDKVFMQSLILWLTKDRQTLPVPAILKPVPLWTGKQIFSLILPEVNHGGQEPHKFKHDDSEVLIRRGTLISGMINKGVVGVAAGSLIHVIYLEKGADEVVRFVNAVQRTVQFYLYQNSFSVGIQDTIIPKDTLDEQKRLMKEAEDAAKAAAAAVTEGTLPKKPGMTLLESFETDSNRILNDARKNAATKALLAVRRTNAFRCMILAGSKGSELNIFQIGVSVGQQNVGGKRITYQFRRRTLPMYNCDDNLPTSRGLVKNGFVAGLLPYEFVFHTMGGREGLIDTACKTAETGYLQRKLIKSMEDVTVAYDGTVRNVTREVVQFTYGEDGLDGHRVEPNQKVDVVRFDDKDMREHFMYEYDPSDGAFGADFGGNYMTPDLKRFLRSDKGTFGVLDREFNQLMRDRDTLRDLLPELSDKGVSVYLPVNIERLIHNAKSFYDVGRSSQQSSLDPRTIIHGVERLALDIRQLFASHHKKRSAQYGATFDNVICESRVADAVQLFTLHLRTMLGSKKVLRDYRLNETAWNYLLSEIRLKYMQAIVHPGEMIGAIAAQSCGEPATQMTLNTFHNAGISSKNVTLGVPRLLELLNVSKNQRVSNMVIRLVPELSTKANSAVALHQIEETTLLNLVTGWSIIYDPDPLSSVLPEDLTRFRLWWAVQQREARHDNMSPWVARIELDADKVYLKSAGAQGVMDTIRSIFEKDAAISSVYEAEFSSDFDASTRKFAVIRLRLKDKAQPGLSDPIAYLRENVPTIMRRLHVRGVPGVTKVFTQEKKVTVINPETGGLKMDKVWFLETEGTALRSVTHVADMNGRPIVDPRLTSTNNIPEINDVLGIEAARKKLLLEMREVYGIYDIRINYRQYSLLVDTMCHRGYIMAVSRTGINRINAVGPLMRCSFEETVGVLMSAAAFGEFDPVRGVSANIAMGRQARIGTGAFDLLLNTDLLREAVPQALAVKSGTHETVYAGQSTVAYREAAEAEMGAGGRDAARARGGAGRFGTPVYDKSIVYGGANNAGAGAAAGGGRPGAATEYGVYGLGPFAGGPGASSYSAVNYGGSSSGAYGASLQHGGFGGLPVRGGASPFGSQAHGNNLVHSTVHSAAHSDSGRGAGDSGSGSRGAHAAVHGSGGGSGSLHQPGLFRPPVPSAVHGGGGGSSMSQYSGFHGGYGVGDGAASAGYQQSEAGSTMFQPHNINDALPAQYARETLQALGPMGDQAGMFRFAQSTEYSQRAGQGSGQGSGHGGDSSHGGGGDRASSYSQDRGSSHSSYQSRTDRSGTSYGTHSRTDASQPDYSRGGYNVMGAAYGGTNNNQARQQQPSAHGYVGGGYQQQQQYGGGSSMDRSSVSSSHHTGMGSNAAQPSYLARNNAGAGAAQQQQQQLGSMMSNFMYDASGGSLLQQPPPQQGYMQPGQPQQQQRRYSGSNQGQPNDDFSPAGSNSSYQSGGNNNNNNNNNRR